jgi:DNA polymerase-3 subunit epsilon
MSDATTPPVITAHAASVEVSDDGVRIERTPMGSTLTDAEFSFPATALRGWYRNAPTATDPGWIQFSLAGDTPDGYLARPVRGYPATHGAPNIVAFAPGQLEPFADLDRALTNLQAGYPLGAATPVPEDAAPTAPAATAPSTDSPAQATEQAPATAATASPKKKSGGKGNPGWKRVSTPDVVPEPDLTADANGPVFGQNVTVTGDVEPYDKGEIWDMIAAAGGTVGKNVTKKTTALVIGSWGSVTSKEKRARELRDKGQDIALWSLDEFLTKVGRQPRPDFDEVRGTDAPF